MRTVEEIEADIANCSATGIQKQLDGYWLEWFRAVADGIEPARLRELCEADREGRAVVLPCKVGQKCYVTYTVVQKDCPYWDAKKGVYACLYCDRSVCPKHVVEKVVEGYKIDEEGLSNPGEWDCDGGLDGYEPVYRTPAEAEAAMKEALTNDTIR